MDKPCVEDLVAEHRDHFVSYLREGEERNNNAEEVEGEREEAEGSHQYSEVPFLQWLCGWLLCIHLSTLLSTPSGGEHVHVTSLLLGSQLA